MSSSSFPLPGPGPFASTGSITTFRDAVGLAMAIADDYAFANVSVLLDIGERSGSPDAGAVLDAAILEGIGATIEPLVSWATASPLRLQNRHRAGAVVGVLILSIRPYEVDIIREQDLALYRRARWAIAGAGLHLVDWIETDGDLFRSYAYVTCPAEAWVHDPPAEREWDRQPR